ncbi:MAG TPA: hypothetical protein VNJ04_16290 [Gemmatimonadaceae bacterium]|nr:hypothetical protein [Gemmatimonadaceae bacterium]
MDTPRNDAPVPDSGGQRGTEAAFGGADAVNDTPDIAGRGATPGTPFDTVMPTPQKRAGGSRIVWLAVIVALGILLAYAAGMLR